MRDETEEQSLEMLEEHLEKRWSTEEDDEEVALEELIDAMVVPEPVGGPAVPNAVGEAEFICSSCQLVRPVASLADLELVICSECADRGLTTSASNGSRGRSAVLV
jgi:uncharacterized protein DUF4193